MIENPTPPGDEPRLAAVYGQDRPGLPRGRSSLPASVVREEQRRRLRGAVIAAVAEAGYAHTTVAMVVQRARVSRKAFYDHFAGVEDCFLSAMAEAQEAIVAEVMTPPRDAERPSSSRELLRAALGAYLALCAREPEYARCILVELPAVGPRALRGRLKGYGLVADVLRGWREHAARKHPEWPPVPEHAFTAAVGAVAELILVHVSEGRADELPALRDPLTEILLRILDAPLPG
ncbi:Bacterial regulatory protein, tetR family [Actinomadura rubteroloni]|uniref:Bacterial regulatory protein, tetR family n=1 Tax=Actinomadura rubteroloni TaxID=1926885 RepID=A0A2P4UQ86_9ACTN|nr:TetR/AcrR family transcriptional regulator [Actinomadura rubteroloni]POM27200.1 Bacterial regulatory protein, tetR family [Actinomadura rubteroloni]